MSAISSGLTVWDVSHVLLNHWVRCWHKRQVYMSYSLSNVLLAHDIPFVRGSPDLGKPAKEKVQEFHDWKYSGENKRLTFHIRNEESRMDKTRIRARQLIGLGMGIKFWITSKKLQPNEQQSENRVTWMSVDVGSWSFALCPPRSLGFCKIPVYCLFFSFTLLSPWSSRWVVVTRLSVV